MDNCIFCKIVSGEIPSKKVYEDELCCGFLDNAPKAPVHVLFVPKEHIASASEINQESEALVGHIFSAIARYAREEGFSDSFRVVTNCGESAGQSVFHLHFHVLAGQAMGEFN